MKQVWGRRVHSFEHVHFEVPIGSPSGGFIEAIGYICLESEKEVRLEK